MNAPIQLRTTIPPLLLPWLLACFGLLPRAQATDLDSVLPNGNTADGSGVLVSLTSGVWNSGFGFQVLNHDTAGKSNTATGVRALFSDTSGSNNTANGVYALYGNTNGWYNNAVGAYALSNNIIGHFNTANGYAALYRNDADGNTATTRVGDTARMYAFTVEPPTVTWTVVSPGSVVPFRKSVIAPLSAPSPVPKITNRAPWAIPEFGSPGGARLAAFATPPLRIAGWANNVPPATIQMPTHLTNFMKSLRSLMLI